jgi:hypothetical protein
MLKISKTVIHKLIPLVQDKPFFTGTFGSLFASTTIPAGCIKLTTPKDEYLSNLLARTKAGSIPRFKIIPVDNQNFDCVVLGQIAVDKGELVIDGKKADIL